MNKQDDEEFNSYFAMDAHYMGRIFFTMSTCLTLGGLYFAAHPHYLEESWNSNGTHYVIENYKVWNLVINWTRIEQLASGTSRKFKIDVFAILKK